MRVKRSFAVQVITDPMEAVRRMVYGTGALEACAGAVGVSHQTLSKQISEAEGNTLSLRRAAAIEQFMDSDAMAECFAARRGGIFVKLPQLPDGNDPAFMAGYSKLIGEFAEASKSFSEAVSDGSLTGAEVDRFEKEFRDVTIAAQQLVHAARAKVQGD